MRLFVALEIDHTIRGKIARFLEGAREFAPAARWVAPQSLHVTLKFIGESEQVEAIRKALAPVRMAPVELSFRGIGFFPSERAARVCWVGIHAHESLAALAAAIDDALVATGVEREQRAYTPHLTLARAAARGGARANRGGDEGGTPPLHHPFTRLQEKLARLGPADFGTMTAQEFFLFQSTLKPGGAVYTRLAGFGQG